MSDLISRQAAIDWFMEISEDDSLDFRTQLYAISAANEIKRIPTADRPTGKWVLDPNGMDWDISAWRCSECGFVATHIGVEPNGLGGSPLTWAGSKFCPQCGVKIIGYER